MGIEDFFSRAIIQGTEFSNSGRPSWPEETEKKCRLAILPRGAERTTTTTRLAAREEKGELCWKSKRRSKQQQQGGIEKNGRRPKRRGTSSRGGGLERVLRRGGLEGPTGFLGGKTSSDKELKPRRGSIRLCRACHGD